MEEGLLEIFLLFGDFEAAFAQLQVGDDLAGDCLES